MPVGARSHLAACGDGDGSPGGVARRGTSLPASPHRPVPTDAAAARSCSLSGLLSALTTITRPRHE